MSWKRLIKKDQLRIISSTRLTKKDQLKNGERSISKNFWSLLEEYTVYPDFSHFPELKSASSAISLQSIIIFVLNLSSYGL